MFDKIEKYVEFFPLLRNSIKYNLIIGSKQGLNEKYLKNCKIWENKNQMITIPASDLIIFKDSEEFWKLNTKELIQEFYDSIIGNGFLITVFRYRLTEPELALNSLKENNILKNNEFENRIEEFENLAKIIGFKLISTKSDSISTMALMFRKIVEILKNQKIIKLLKLIQIMRNGLNYLKRN